MLIAMLIAIRTAVFLGLLGLMALAAAAAGPVAPSDPAAIEAYRRLPYCRLAPDGKHLAEEPCRRPPTRSFSGRRTVPALSFPPLPAQTPGAAPATGAVPPVAVLPSAVLSPATRPSTAMPSASVPPVVSPVLPSVPSPAIQPLNQCGIAGCRGANGTLYQQGAGSIMLDPSGRMCTQHGQWVHCQ